MFFYGMHPEVLDNHKDTSVCGSDILCLAGPPGLTRPAPGDNYRLIASLLRRLELLCTDRQPLTFWSLANVSLAV